MRDLECNNACFEEVANCDHVYELLSVKSNELLVVVVNELWIINPKYFVITIVERKHSEDSDTFLDMT